MNLTQSIHILLIEDNPADARLVQEMFKNTAFSAEITHVSQLSAILAITETPKFDLILTDLNLPDSSGLNTVLKVQNIFPNTPIVVMTGFDNEELSIAAIQAGAQDYLVKGKTDPQQLQKTIQYAINRYQTLQKINEVSEKQKVFLATHDPLTGLPNQQLFLEQLKLLIEKHKITGKLFALLLLEIHEVDKIIEIFGHTAKDDLAKAISTNLTKENLESTFIARYNENVFAILISQLLDVETILLKTSLIQRAVEKNIVISNKEYFPSYNIGISVYPSDGDDSESLIKIAQQALKKAVHYGVNKCEIYTKNIIKLPQDDQELIWYSDLYFALERNEFFILYQPQVDITTQKVNGVEALLRWQHPKFGIIHPEKFIPIAEDCHLITPIGTWVLENVGEQYKNWKNKIAEPLTMRVSINVSVQQLQRSNLVELVQNIITKYQIPAECFVIELTESIFIDQPETVIEKLHQLKQLGIQIAIDDFGKGYSSLSYLSHLPINHLKLDMNFVQKIAYDAPTQIIVKSVIDLAHSLDLIVTAEGAETTEQFNLLKNKKCDEVQGNYFSRPVTHSAIFNLISNGLVIQPNQKG